MVCAASSATLADARRNPTLLTPVHGTAVAGVVTLFAIAGGEGDITLQFTIDGEEYGPEVSSDSVRLTLDTTTLADGPHRVQAVSRDDEAREATSEAVTIHVFNAAPYVTRVTVVDVKTTSATIRWATPVLADGLVEIGLTAEFGTSKYRGALVSEHAHTLTGLEPGTTYHFRVTSATGTGVSQTSDNFSFTTPLVDPKPAPASPVASESRANGSRSTTTVAPPKPRGVPCTSPDPFIRTGGVGICVGGEWILLWKSK